MIYIGSSDSEEIIKNIIKMWQNILKNDLMYLLQKTDARQHPEYKKYKI